MAFVVCFTFGLGLVIAFFPGFTGDRVMREGCNEMTIGAVGASGHFSHVSTSSSVADLHSQLHPGEGDKSDTEVPYHICCHLQILEVRTAVSRQL